MDAGDPRVEFCERVRISLSSDGGDVLTTPVRQPEPSGPIEVEHTPDELIVRLLDPAADPAEVEQELRAAGVAIDEAQDC
jgi:hypothetical protein